MGLLDGTTPRTGTRFLAAIEKGWFMHIGPGSALIVALVVIGCAGARQSRIEAYKRASPRQYERWEYLIGRGCIDVGMVSSGVIAALGPASDQALAGDRGSRILGWRVSATLSLVALISEDTVSDWWIVKEPLHLRNGSMVRSSTSLEARIRFAASRRCPTVGMSRANMEQLFGPAIRESSDVQATRAVFQATAEGGSIQASLVDGRVRSWLPSPPRP
jgi:hypothetical protein